jgi:hypothetical protein
LDQRVRVSAKRNESAFVHSFHNPGLSRRRLRPRCNRNKKQAQDEQHQPVVRQVAYSHQAAFFRIPGRPIIIIKAIPLKSYYLLLFGVARHSRIGGWYVWNYGELQSSFVVSAKRNRGGALP